MNCPQCHKELPPGYAAARCPYCAGGLVSQSPRFKVNWWVFILVLLSPPVVTMLVVLLGGRDGDTAPQVASVASILAGLACGIMLGTRQGSTISARIALSILFSGVMFVACMGMSCFGCLASGYNLNLH